MTGYDLMLDSMKVAITAFLAATFVIFLFGDIFKKRDK